METLILGFPQILEEIFEKLDNESLTKCREVQKSWKKLIDDRRYPWIRIVNIPKILSGGNTYLHIAAKYGQIEVLNEIISEEGDKDPKNERGSTPFLVACQYGQSELVKMLIKNSADLKIDLKQH